MKHLCTSVIFLLSGFTSFNLSAVPEKCVQLPTRTTPCTNLLFKKSPVAVPIMQTEKGEMVCLCMDDFNELRIEAESELEKIDQQVALSRAAEKLGMSETDLLILIRK